MRSNSLNPRAFNSSLKNILDDLGLSTNLKLCLDAGDSASYSSGQSWLDRSGNGYDFFRGATSGSEASDPTFNGTPGNVSRNEYWSLDGADYFRYDSANETWMQNIHKNNAIFTIATWVKMGALGGTAHIAGTMSNNAVGNIGFLLRKKFSTDLIQFTIQGNAGAAVLDISTAVAMTSTTDWYFVAVSLNEATGANGCIINLNSTAELFTSTYTSPSAASATATMEIGASGSANNPLPSGSCIGEYAMWEGTALTQAQLTAIYETTRRRYGV